MDTPNSPENEPEEITWQDDKKRVPLFLRSVVVLLSGTLIICQWPKLFSAMTDYVGPAGAGNNILACIECFVLSIVVPVFIIRFFFGQRLRSVESLSDQKYNAWNYGCNFTEWKLHLKWLAGICILLLLWILSYSVGQSYPLFPPMSSSDIVPFLIHTLSLLLVIWLIVACIVWVIFGYLLFGCAQGFSPTITIVLLTAVEIVWYIFASKNSYDAISVTTILFFAFVTLAALTICWATKSFAPVLYIALLFTGLLTVYFSLSFRGLMCC